MNAPEVVSCAGAPRDLGLDQGRAFAARIAQEAAQLRPDGRASRWAFERRSDGRAAAVRRDTLRYFPHMAERAMGLAAGSRVGERALAGLLGRAFHASADVVAVLSGERTGGAACIVRSLRPGKEVFVRHSAPDSDYHSVEAALPWRVPALAGVNQHGLAVASVAAPADPAGGHLAPAVLLTQDALQRFDGVEKALEWLERRPAGGAADFVLADATGAVAAFEIRPKARRRIPLESGARVLGGGPDRAVWDAAVESAGGRDASALCAAAAGTCIVLDPARARMATADAQGPGSWHRAAAPPAA